MMRRILSAMSLACFVAAIGGCQSWSQVGQGFPAGSRVAPPGTGTYNVPSSYYNGPKAGAAGGGTINGNASVTPNGSGAVGRTAALPTGQVPNEVVPASYQIPTVDQVRTGINNSAGAVLSDVTNRANQAIQNGTARAASTVQQYTPPGFNGAPPAFATSTASQSISDSSPPPISEVGPPKLEWQSPR